MYVCKREREKSENIEIFFYVRYILFLLFLHRPFPVRANEDKNRAIAVKRKERRAKELVDFEDESVSCFVDNLLTPLTFHSEKNRTHRDSQVACANRPVK